jgi:aspartate racemase
MRTIGLLGGMSWESTALYYRALNEGVRERLGGLHSASLVLHSVDFEPIEQMQRHGEWARAGAVLASAARSVEAGGADFLLLCTNTMHKVIGSIEAAVTIPVLHIADATAQALAERGVHTVGLLATAFTMEKEFYKGRLQARHGLEVLVPDAPGRALVHRIIYEELCLGVVREDSRAQVLRIVDALARRGAQGVVLGCTEIGLLIGAAHTDVPLFDTTLIHARQAVREALRL